MSPERLEHPLWAIVSATAVIVEYLGASWNGTMYPSVSRQVMFHRITVCARVETF